MMSVGNEMRVCGANDGWLLDHRMFSYGDYVASPSGVVPSVWNTKHNGHCQLLHERYYNGFHRRSGSRDNYRALETPPQNRPRSNEDCRLHPWQITRRFLYCNHVNIDVGFQYRGHRHDGTNHICGARGTGTGLLF